MLKKLFLILSKHNQAFAPREQSHILANRNETFNNEADMDNGLWTDPNNLDAAHWFFAYLNWDHIASVVSNNTRYTIQEGWTRFAQYNLQTNNL